MSRHSHKRGEGERGFALLLVFVMAAAIALMLYRQMPRVAFESERDKEQLLIDRGAQYQRAIQVYFVTFKRYPSRIEDLENTNDHRFLRRRYIDPYTGKTEWRLIHTNGMTLTDSKVQLPPNPAGNGTGSGTGNGNGASSTSTSTSTSSNTSSTGAGGQVAPPAVNATVASRPSDRTLPDNQSYSNPTPVAVYNQTAQNNAPYTPPNYNDPAQFPPISLFPNGYNAATQNGQPPNGLQTNPNQPGLNQPGLNQPGFNPNQPGFNPNQSGGNPPGPPAGLTVPGLPAGMNVPTLPAGLTTPAGLPNGLNQPGLNQPGLNQPGLNQPGLNQPGLNQPGISSTDPSQQYPSQQYPGQQLPGQQSFVQPSPVPQAPVQQLPQLPGQPPPGQGQFNPNNPGAAGAANPGLNIINQLLTTPRPAPSGIGAATANQTIGGGIAGVASTFTGATIKSYGGRTDYSEWEFVFQLPQQTGIPQNTQQQNGQNAPGTSQGFSGPGGASMPSGPPPGAPPPPPPGGFPAVPSLPPH